MPAVRLFRPALIMALVVLAPRAHAELYSVPILVDSEDGIFDLFDNEDIIESEFDILTELYQKKVDLNRATRDELFELPGLTYPMVDEILKSRREGGLFVDLDDVIAREILSDDVIAQIGIFTSFGRAKLDLGGKATGSLRLKSIDRLGDGELPASYLRGRVSALDGRFDAGLVAMVQERPGRLSVGDSTPGSEYFLAGSDQLRVEPLEKAFATYTTDVGETGRARVVLGNFNAGFGERLTLDTTNRRRPYGLYGDDLMYDNVGGIVSFNSAVRPHRGLMGLAGSVEGIKLGDTMRLDVTLLGSWRNVDEYIYRFRPNRTYFSPEDAAQGEPSCVGQGRCHGAVTFRDVYNQAVGGGNARLWVGDRAYVGATGYVARNRFLTGDDFTFFAPSARQPIRDAFGAGGLEFGFGTGLFDAFGEVTLTDRGGTGALLRTLWDLNKVALEATGRYYDRRFDNPLGRGEATASQFLGLRARDEAGAKVRATWEPNRRVRLTSQVDSWVHPSQERHDTELYMRGELLPTRGLRLAAWGRYFDKDLSVGGRDQDYSFSPTLNYDEIYDLDDPDSAMEDLRSGAERLARGLRKEGGAQVTITPNKKTTIATYGRLVWRDIATYDTYFERGLSTWVRASHKPVKWLDLSTRLRYFDDDIDSIREDRDGDGFYDYERGNAFVDVYGRVAVSFPKRFRGSLRYDLRRFVDVKVRSNYAQHLVRLVGDYTF